MNNNNNGHYQTHAYRAT